MWLEKRGLKEKELPVIEEENQESDVTEAKLEVKNIFQEGSEPLYQVLSQVRQRSTLGIWEHRD